MKGAEGTAEEQEHLNNGNNNGSLDCKLPCEPVDEVDMVKGPLAAFHSTRMFMLVFLSGWVLQGMFLTYFVGVTTTVEKLFRIESKTTGVLLAATEIGQICTALFLTYAAGRGHRPRWIGCMMLVFAIGVIGCVLPHVLYGTRLLDVHLGAHNGSDAALCGTGIEGGGVKCDEAQRLSSAAHSSMTAVVIPWLFVCLLVVGVGQTGIATLGIPYIDDNVGSRQSPLYMAITIGIRVIGPALGFLLGALCTRVYVDPLIHPDFSSTDPQWVGAWWLGMVVISSLIVLLSTLMFLFPRQIKRRECPSPPMPPAKKIEKNDHFFTDFFSTIKRQLTNDILMCRTASSVLHLMPISGLYSFLPKYLEKQFRLAPYDANLVSGTGGILVMGLGIITSGIVILKLVPSARAVAAWTAATAAIYSTGMVILMFVGCPQEQYSALTSKQLGYENHGSHMWNNSLDWNCNADCHCDNVKIKPVCGQDGLTFLSPCKAGCQQRTQLNDSTWFYYNCSCIDHSTVADIPALYKIREGEVVMPPGVIDGFAVGGECYGGCVQFYIFLTLFAVIMFVHASGEVGSVLLIIRCTDPHDKAMAMGVIQFAIGVFGNVPCPIIFGAAVDAACYARDVVCEALGACAVYDNDRFRHFYLGLTAGIMFLAFIMDLFVWRKASRIDMNPEDSAPVESAPDVAPLAAPVVPTDTQV